MLAPVDTTLALMLSKKQFPTQKDGWTFSVWNVIHTRLGPRWDYVSIVITDVDQLFITGIIVEPGIATHVYHAENFSDTVTFINGFATDLNAGRIFPGLMNINDADVGWLQLQ